MTTKDYYPGGGYSNAKLMIITECPSYSDIPGKGFANSSYRELDKLLKEAGIDSSRVWLTNACKYFVTPNPKGGRKIPFKVRAEREGVDFLKELNDLQTEINSIRPNAILALGSTALYATTGKTSIQNYRGSILFGAGYKVISTYDPKGLSFQEQGEFIGYWNRPVILLDLIRAHAQSQFSELKLPHRTLQIAKSSFQLQEFITRYKNHTNPAVDIEARGSCLPYCIGVAFTPHHGMTVPLWNDTEMNSIAVIPDGEMVQLWLILSELLARSDVVGQSFKYDEDKIRRFGFAVRSLASDTMLKSFAINPELPKSLGFNTSIYTEEPFYKNEGMYEGKLEDLLVGCARDACVTKEIDLKMDADLLEINGKEYYENFIIKLHQFYLDIDGEGFHIDPIKRDELFRKYIKWSEELNYELYTIAGAEINVNSASQVSLLLYENWKIPRRHGTGEEEITAILNLQSSKLTPNQRRGCEIILEKRRVDKTINNYLAAMPDYDQRMKTVFFPCLETGRSSTNQLEPPIRPTIDIIGFDGKKKHKSIGIAFQTMTKHGDIGADVRSQYIPEKGYVFVQADGAQAEARVVFLLANDEQALYDIDHHDYHALTATYFFGGVEFDYSKKALGYEHPIRFAGKTLRHAGHLGAGKGRASKELNTQARKYKIPISITEAFADKALKIFHAKQPKIQQVFHAGVIEALNKDKRYLTASVPYGVDAKIGGRRQFFERYGEELFRQSFSYIPQRSISDHTKAAGMRLRTREPKLARIIIECHDSLLFTVPESELNYFVPIIQEEMTRPIRFDTCSLPRHDLVIPCDIEVGYNYMDLSKYRSNHENQSTP